MKKMITVIAAIACIFTLVTSLTGCTAPTKKEEKAEKTAVCYVIANTANSKGLNFNTPLVQDTVYSTIRNYGYIAVVNADGNPEVVHAASYDIPNSHKGASKEKLDTDARSKATNVIMSMQGLVADDPEVDYHKSLTLAVRALASLNGYDSKEVIVVGNGLSTIGVLDFNKNLICAEPNTIVNLLKEKSEIPDFSGLTVYWQQLGDTETPQKDLTAAQKIKLQDIYSGIVEAGGGEFCYNEVIANPVNKDIDYPSVTPVELPDETPIEFEKNDTFKEPVVIPEEKVGFVADKAIYLKPDEVKKTLNPIAQCIIKNKIKILLCGTTAGDNNDDYALSLSRQRAEKVKETLVELGVDESLIIAVGLGSTDPWHISGAGSEGTVASSNRKVVLLDATSDTAISILKKN